MAFRERVDVVVAFVLVELHMLLLLLLLKDLEHVELLLWVQRRYQQHRLAVPQ